MNFTFQELTVAAGIGASALFALTFTQVLKAGIPAIFNRITGGTMSFLILAAIYIIGGIVLSPLDANGYLGLLVAWTVAAMSALGLHSVANNGAATFVQSGQPDSPPPPK